ncbi:MAG: NUDIX hydrolase N-terminal domain-containing protein [Herpetosiphonaceae bacterium]|nr:NUDIX hydrolase N-terminal domain-containing protein [Herpetosiphonaceae bacterium]
MTPVESIALWADMLRDITATGLKFAQGSYERDNYQKIQTIALEMFAVVADQPLNQLEPLRSVIFKHPGPISGGDAAIIDEQGRILLVQRADDHKWAMPGGGLAVGETPAEGVEREALEETGIRCQATLLVGVFDSRLCGTVSLHHLYQYVFLCKLLDAYEVVNPSSHAHEVLATRWFAEHALPTDLSPGHALRINAAFHAWHGDQSAYFDHSNAAPLAPS